MLKNIDNQRGAFLVIFAIAVVILLGFVALGIEAGQWYLVRSELSKSVDSAALAAAKNISNPFVDARTVAIEFGNANFEAGYLGTPTSGTGSVQFSPAVDTSTGRVTVTGRVNAEASLARLFGVTTIPVNAVGGAQRKEVEIMMVLDRSGSMAGTKMTDLKRAARNFLQFFNDTQDRDKVGFVSFATTAKLDRALGINFVSPMTTAINNMNAIGATNTADSIIRTIGTGGFSNQTGLPGDRRVQQFLVFFSDGQPTAFGGRFKRDGADFNAAAAALTNCRTWETPTPWNNMGNPDESQPPETMLNINPDPTGDGKRTSGSDRTTCSNSGGRYINTRWYVFDTRPVPGYSATACDIPANNLGRQICNIARDMASENAQAVKNRYIKIYTIGLGNSNQIDEAFLRNLSSDCNNGSCTGNNFSFVTPDSSELEAIFNRIARDIKLRLVY